MISKSQIDKLGERLRNDVATEDDLIALDEYRLSFAVQYDRVAEAIHITLGLKTTGRQAKTTVSITRKLLRQRNLRLSQMQDIVGLRLVADDIVQQDKTVADLVELFPGSSVDDRRVKPSYGYRAVHVIVKVDDRFVEIQVRTKYQHIWAEVCEKLADAFDPMVKYGSGDSKVLEALESLTIATLEIEALPEYDIAGVVAEKQSAWNSALSAVHKLLEASGNPQLRDR